MGKQQYQADYILWKNMGNNMPDCDIP